MTEADFQQIWVDIKTEIVAVITANVEAGTKVVSRDTFDNNGATWLGRLVDSNGKVRCWSVFYNGTAALDDKETPGATESFVPMFRIAGFREYDFGTNANNSTDKHMAELNKLRFAFMQNQSLGLPDVVESHSGFIDDTKLGQIDSRPVHISKIDLGIHLHPIPYDYDNA